MASEASNKTQVKIEKPTKIVMNVSDTKYAVVKYVGRKLFGWRLSNKQDDMDWDVMWTDNAVEPDRLARMKQYQKINHFPGMYALARKNHLARNLGKMQKMHPEEYDFFPRTWLVPAEHSELRLYMAKAKNKTFIVKPEASCQGRGIFLTRRIEDISPQEHYVVQQYLNKPFLLDEFKFDLRIYVLVTGCAPLRVFVHEEGLARLATEKYVKPCAGNMGDMCMHLTNYAVNKNNPNFVFNTSVGKDDIGHKRSLTSTMKLFAEMGRDVERLWAQIHDMIVKTICAVQPGLAHTYRSCQPEDYHNAMCFELLGLDVILDSKFRPYLLEVNHSPSFTADTPLDKAIKRKVISEALTLMNIDNKQKRKYLTQQKLEIMERTLKGRTIKQAKESRERNFQKAQKQRDGWESQHLGGFTKVYPINDSAKYEGFLQTANEVWNQWTGGPKAKTPVPRSVTPQGLTTSRGKPLPKLETSISTHHAKMRSISNSELPEPEDSSPSSVSKAESVFSRLSKPSVKVSQPIILGTHYQNLVDPSEDTTVENQVERLSRMFPNYHILMPPVPPRNGKKSLIRTLQYLLQEDRGPMARGPMEGRARSEGGRGSYLVPRMVNFTAMPGLNRPYV